VEEDLKWFDTYLFGTTSMEARVAERLLAETAPLALLEVETPAQVDGRYGVLEGEALVPETVVLGDTLRVGRFEVTRAQFQAYDTGYTVPPGTANYPASGITAEAAQGYVDWLSETTGRTYRLPTEDERKALEKARTAPEENTPAHWAGFTPTPDEMARLRTRLEAQRVDALLMPVGRLAPGHGDPAKGEPVGPLVYDVGGNVAEWTAGEDGLVPMGNSALTLKDARSEEAPDVPDAVRGLRVVEE
jgi:formylglycine-generating enzyme required for sulfatase activity